MDSIKYCIILLHVVFTSVSVFAQTDDDPVLWSQELNQLTDDEYELIFKAKIFEGWHVYSQFTAEGGSMPSFFEYEGAGDTYELIGKTEESKTITEYSDIFEVDETFFKKNAIFTQKIRLLNSGVKQISVDLFYQVCKEVCIPADKRFIFSLDGSAVVVEEKTVDEKSIALSSALKLDLKNKELLRNADGNGIDANSGLWMIFDLGFLGGLIALLTPCVFPMIPLTVSFFTKQSKKKSMGIINALLYGFFIILIYFLLSLPFHLFDSVDSQILNTIATGRA